MYKLRIVIIERKNRTQNHMTIFAYKFMSPDYGVGTDLVCLMYSSYYTILNNILIQLDKFFNKPIFYKNSLIEDFYHLST